MNVLFMRLRRYMHTVNARDKAERIIQVSLYLRYLGSQYNACVWRAINLRIQLVTSVFFFFVRWGFKCRVHDPTGASQISDNTACE